MAEPEIESETSPAPGPLAGLKVLEAAQVVAGPVCGMILADLGADVIKVERVPDGDDTRRMAPPEIAGESAAFMMLNRNKRGIALDLKTDPGKEVFRRLAARTDVVIENFRPGTMARLGFGYEALRQINPGLIYCAISGFGLTGPYAARGGYDLIAQAMSGLMSITGEGPGRPPVKVGAPIADFLAGVMSALGVTAAYAHRLQTGEGQMVDTSLFEGAIAATFHHAAVALATGAAPGPMGSAHPLSAPYQAFATADGWIAIGAGNDPNWRRLVEAMGLGDLAGEAQFATTADRMRNLDALDAALAPRFAEQGTAEWLETLEAAGVPAGPVLSVDQMLADPQAIARNMVAEVTHARAGPMKTLGTPVKFSGTPTAIRRAAPTLGQHSAEILAEAGFGDSEIEEFLAAGVVLGEPM